jgi:hypothetical protein|nr:MAG TPA: protein of unknown function (DUF4500) [Crassvirales sp.]
MKKNKVIAPIVIAFISLCLGRIAYLTMNYMSNINNKAFIVKNNNTRDYVYEHYCDSIYEVNPDYYLDVLVETDEFQSYLDEHGEWWTN